MEPLGSQLILPKLSRISSHSARLDLVTAPSRASKRASVSGSGIFRDEASDALMRQVFFDGTVRTFQVIVPDFGTVEGPFQITALEFAGNHNGEITYDLSLESAGALTFTAA